MAWQGYAPMWDNLIRWLALPTLTVAQVRETLERVRR